MPTNEVSQMKHHFSKGKTVSLWKRQKLLKTVELELLSVRTKKKLFYNFQ